MIEPSRFPKAVLLLTFLQRFDDLEAIVRIITSGARLSALLTFRGEPMKRVLMDLSTSPMRIDVDDGDGGLGGRGDIWVTIDDERMHEVFLGSLAPGKALGRRQMLLRGSAAYLAKFIPLFDFAPVLYREHLADLGWPRQILTSPERDTMNAEQNETISTRRSSSQPERWAQTALSGVAFGAGYTIGVLRFRVLKELSLFDLLTSLSQGLEAATPAELKERAGAA